MVTVTVSARYPVTCSDASALDGIECPMRLGPIDQSVLPFIPIAVVFVYPSTHREDEVIPIERLHKASARVLDYYPHLTGRITINPKDQGPEIDRLGSGAEILSAHCAAPLDSFYGTATTGTSDMPEISSRLSILDLPGGGNDLLAPFDPSMEAVCRDPILTIQHTRFACGGVSLGVRLLHIICDADGFFQFVRDLAEIYRSILFSPEMNSDVAVQLQYPPHIQPYTAGSSNLSPEERIQVLKFKPSVYALSEDTTEHVSSSPSFPVVSAAVIGVPPPPVTGRVIRFSPQQLEALKAQANGVVQHLSSSSTQGSPQLSTFDTLSAYLWQVVHRARLRLCVSQGMSIEEAREHVLCDFLSSVNWRVGLCTPSRYFPNCIFCPVFSLPSDHLSEAPLSAIARAVHDAVHALSPDEVVQTVRWLELQPDKRRVKLCFRGGLMVSQWCKFDMYPGATFDAAPTLVAPPFTPISLVDGLVYFVATEEQLQRFNSELSQEPCSQRFSGVSSGSIDVYMSLSEPLWAVLEQDESFRPYMK
eukprot:GILK01006838.1.p1 GENE.GILK01006838.1~~GILK01006838.1.p1  ORF type:complete len:533 (-),score=32.44 GILK01006838.1:97-1695(-)